MNKYWNIQTKLSVVHILLIMMVILGMSIRQYDNQWKMAKAQSLNYYQNLSQQLMTPLTLALTNNNYGNITLPSFVQSLTSIPSLYYLELNGLTDNSNQFQVAYLRKLKDTWRMYYPENFWHQLSSKINKLNVLLAKKPDSIKIQYLINRAEEELSNYKKNQTYSKKLNKELIAINLISPDYFDEKAGKLTIIKQINSKTKAQAIFIYDIKELDVIQKKILQTILYEFFIACIISTILIIYTIRKVTRPIKELTEFISNDQKEINPDNMPGLKHHDEIGILASNFKVLLTDMHKYIEKIEEQANQDFLTKLYNRRYFDKLSEELIILAKREKRQSYAVMIDIDKFKRINDTYGHLIGDEVLKKLANLLEANTRASDIVARFGGEEFAILLPFTEKEGALKISEAIRKIVEDYKVVISRDKIIQFTVSLGVGNIDIKNDTTVSNAIDRADTALYEAKNTGRNKVVVYSQ